MSDFSNPNLNGEDITENTDTSEKAADKQNETEASGFVFNEDGTYHSKPEHKEETAGNNSYNYNHSSDGSSRQNDTGTQPEHNSQENNAQPKREYPYSSGTYPYSNNAGYSYDNNKNAYERSRTERTANPYSQSDRGSYGNPYSSSGNNRYPYEQQNRSYSYAYPEDGGKGDKKKNGSMVFAIIAGALCVFLAIALIAVVAGDKSPTVLEESTTNGVNQNVEEFVTNASPETGNIATDGELTPKNIYAKVLPSSAGILVYDKSKTLASEGTGVLFSESTDGKYTYIITCAHVINEQSGVIMVQLHDGKKYDATVVGFDTRTDIGVLCIEASGLTLAEVGDSSKISVGDYIYAIGNPGGVEFANSFTDGIVSALDRPVNSSQTGYTTECIQHTAAINPGNSGGALVNSFGQVIGINSMKIVADEYEGMGFAVPSSVFVEIVNEILKNGYVSNRPKLGITYVAASEYSTYGMFVAIKGLPSGSIVIYDISADSSFAGTDVQKGDMIVAVNGVGLDDASYLSEVIENSSVGDKLKLSIVRIYDDYSFDEFDVTVTLVEDRGDTVLVEEETTSSYNYPGGNYEDYFNQYFEDFFGNYFGGGYNNP